MILDELKTEGAVIYVLRSTPFGPNTVVTIANRDGWACGSMEALHLFDMPSVDRTA